MVNEGSLLIIDRGTTVTNRTNASSRRETQVTNNPNYTYTGSSSQGYNYENNENNTPALGPPGAVGSKVGGGFIYSSPGGGVTTINPNQSLTPQGQSQLAQQQSQNLARQNVATAREASQRDTNYSIQTNKSFIQTLRDVTARQEQPTLNKSQVLSNPVGAFSYGVQSVFTKGGQALSNIGTTLGGVFGYGVYSTPTYLNQSDLKSSGSTIGGFGIPIFSLGQVYKQRDVAEQGQAIQSKFITSLSGLNQSSKEYSNTFNYGSQQLTASGLGSTNSTGSFNFNMPQTIQGQIYNNPNSTRTEKFIATSNVIVGKTAEAFAGGFALKSLGVIGGIARGTEYIAGSGSIGKSLAITGGTVLTVAPVVSSSISGYKDFSARGGSGTKGLVIGGLTGLGEVSGFVTGASGGEFLFVPGVKYRSFGIADKLGNTPTKVLALENPFGKSSYPLVTKTTEGFNLGYPKEIKGSTFGLTKDLSVGDYAYQASSKTEVGFVNRAIKQGDNRLGTEQLIFEKGLDITQGLSKVKIKEVNQLAVEKSGVFKNLEGNQPAKDLISNTFKDLGAEQKGVKGFMNAVNNRGLERIYGSSTISSEGGFKSNVMRTNSEFGDFDLNFRGNAISQAEKLFKGLKTTGADVKIEGSLISLKNPKSGEFEHAFDFHGADTPDLQMKSLKLGMKGVSTKDFSLTSGNIKGQQLRQSLVDKGSATLQLRVNKNNQFFFSPPDYRIKDVSDFVSIATRLNEVKGGNVFGPKIESFKNVLKVAYPEIKFDTESKLLFGSASKSSQSLGLNLPSVSSLSSNSKSTFSLGSSNYKSYSNSISSSFSSKSLSPSSYSSPSFSPSAYSPYSSPGYSPSPSPYPSKYPSPYPSPSSYPSPSPSPSSFSSFISSPGFGAVPEFSFGGYTIPKPRKRGRKSPFSIAPSFTAIVENIKMKDTLKVSKTFGVTPFQTRGLLKAGSNKAYAKLTDL